MRVRVRGRGLRGCNRVCARFRVRVRVGIWVRVLRQRKGIKKELLYPRVEAAEEDSM